jgi:hypothetical protein
MTQKAKRSPRPKKANTVPLMVVRPVATREEGEVRIEGLLPKTHLDEVQIEGLFSKIHLDNVGLTVVEGVSTS